MKPNLEKKLTRILIVWTLVNFWWLFGNCFIPRGNVFTASQTLLMVSLVGELALVCGLVWANRHELFGGGHEK